MSSWQPTDQGLSELLQLLREAVNPSNEQNVQEVSKSSLSLHEREYIGRLSICLHVKDYVTNLNYQSVILAVL
jgi:hypothetical protein